MEHAMEHGGYLVPVRLDRDGTFLVVCVLDWDAGIGQRTDGWALLCPACRALVSEPLRGTAQLDLDGAPAAIADPLLHAEAALSRKHHDDAEAWADREPVAQHRKCF